MKSKLLTVIIAAACFIGCEKLAELANFDIKAQTSIQVNSSTILNTPFEIHTPGITTNSNEEFENKHTNATLIKKVVLEELKLTITNPNDKTFNFMKKIHVYISTDDNPEIELAYLDVIPENQDSITLVTSKENLMQFVKATSYKLRTSIETKETLTEATDIQVDMKFNVTAGIL